MPKTPVNPANSTRLSRLGDLRWFSVLSLSRTGCSPSLARMVLAGLTYLLASPNWFSVGLAGRPDGHQTANKFFFKFPKTFYNQHTSIDREASYVFLFIFSSSLFQCLFQPLWPGLACFTLVESLFWVPQHLEVFKWALRLMRQCLLLPWGTQESWKRNKQKRSSGHLRSLEYFYSDAHCYLQIIVTTTVRGFPSRTSLSLYCAVFCCKKYKVLC